MVYDAGGKLAAEYAPVAPPPTANIQYVTNNYQGSTSVVTNNSGGVVSRHDYLPFGEELGAGVGSRTTAKSFSQYDNVRQKYAGLETDSATGMAHTLWRKQDNWSGRWTSPDPNVESMNPISPQSFNRYTYCDNDPVNKVDLSGLALSDIGVYQTDNPAVAATLETEMTRRFRVLTSPGGIAYVAKLKEQEKKVKELAKQIEQNQKSEGKNKNPTSLGKAPTLYNASAEEQQRFEEAWAFLNTVFQSNPAAVRKFGVWKKINEVAAKLVFAMGDLSRFEKPDMGHVDAYFNDVAQITIATNRGFMANNQEYLVNGKSYSVNIVVMQGETLGRTNFGNDVSYSAFVLFHELAHACRVFKNNDGNNPTLTGQNNAELFKLVPGRVWRREGN